MWKRVVTGLVLTAGLSVLSGCGEEQGTDFVIQTGSPSASPSASASTAPSPSATEGPATPIPGGARIIIDSPDAATTINSPIQVSGTASLPSPTVVVAVLDAAGNELGRASTTASAVAPAFGHFDISVDFTGALPGTLGQIKAYGVKADGVTPTWYYFIRIRFG